MFKTRRTLVDALERTVARVHPYEVPQFVVVPIVHGSKAYLAWIDGETRPAKSTALGRNDPAGVGGGGPAATS